MLKTYVIFSLSNSPLDKFTGRGRHGKLLGIRVFLLGQEYPFFIPGKVLMMDPTLPQIIAGEGGTGGFCNFIALLAIAWVYTRNKTMYGCSSPDSSSYLAATTYKLFPDFSYGSYYVFSKDDLEDPAVKQIIAEGSINIIYPCRSGAALIFIGQ